MEEIRVAGWSELHELLYADSWNDELRLHRSNFAFRGRALGDDERLGDDYVVFVEPPSFDDRIVNHYALFSLTSQPDVSLDRWLESLPS